MFKRVYLLLCQFHVLRAIGQRLQGKRYSAFTHELDQSGVKGRLTRLVRELRKVGGKSREAARTLAWAEEILGTEGAADSRTFPFYLPTLELYRVCRKVEGELKAVLSRPGRRARGKPYLKLQGNLARLHPTPRSRERLERDFPVLWEKWRWFERIRRALGYRNGPVPLSPRG